MTTTPAITEPSTASKDPELATPSQGRLTSDESDCLYQSEGAGVAITAVLALLVALLLTTNALTIILWYYCGRSEKTDPYTCELPPQKGAVNHSFTEDGGVEETVTVFTNSTTGECTCNHGCRWL